MFFAITLGGLVGLLVVLLLLVLIAGAIRR